MTADFTCAPLTAPGSAPMHHLAVTFPGGVAPDAEGLAHLVGRFPTATSFVYGVETLLAHPALEATGDCVTHAGSKTPYFSIVKTAVDDSGGFTLTLTPTFPAAVFSYLSVRFRERCERGRT
jgi:hypothetical protein